MQPALLWIDYYYYLRISQEVFKPVRGDLLEKELLLGYIVMMVYVNKASGDKLTSVELTVHSRDSRGQADHDRPVEDMKVFLATVSQTNGHGLLDVKVTQENVTNE